MPKLKVGDFVLFAKGKDPSHQRGYIRYLQMESAAVEFPDARPGHGHSCDGMIPNDKGWWCNVDQLSLVCQTPREKAIYEYVQEELSAYR